MAKSWEDVEETLGEREFDHQITYYVDGRMTMEQWCKLDDLMSDALVEVLGEDHGAIGFAGPIPFEDEVLNG